MTSLVQVELAVLALHKGLIELVGLADALGAGVQLALQGVVVVLVVLCLGELFIFYAPLTLYMIIAVSSFSFTFSYV